MTLFGVIQLVVHLLLGAVGLGMFFVGAWGGLRVPRWRVDLVLTLKQRLWCTAMGVLLMAVAWNFVSEWGAQGS